MDNPACLPRPLSLDEVSSSFLSLYLFSLLSSCTAVWRIRNFFVRIQIFLVYRIRVRKEQKNPDSNGSGSATLLSYCSPQFSYRTIFFPISLHFSLHFLTVIKNKDKMGTVDASKKNNLQLAGSWRVLKIEQVVMWDTDQETAGSKWGMYTCIAHMRTTNRQLAASEACIV